jgi:hypothetical protein
VDSEGKTLQRPIFNLQIIETADTKTANNADRLWDGFVEICQKCLERFYFHQDLKMSKEMSKWSNYFIPGKLFQKMSNYANLALLKGQMATFTHA